MNEINRRVTSCRLISNMQKYPEFSNALGLVNQSAFKGKRISGEKRKERSKDE